MTIENNPNSVGSRIKALRRGRFTQKQLALKVGVSSVTIGVWERNIHPPKGPNLAKLASTLNTSIDHIVNNVPTTHKPRHHNYMQLPLISWTTAATWQPGDAMKIGAALGWRSTTATISEDGFVLEVLDDSMMNLVSSPCIPTGSYIFVEPNRHPPANSIVVARLENQPTAILKKLIIDGPNRYLKPLNPEYKAILINENCEFIGIVKQVIIEL